MINHLGTLREVGDEFELLVFVKCGVELTVKSSEILSDLKKLAGKS